MFPNDELRRKLTRIGIPAEQQDLSVLLGFLPADDAQPRIEDADTAAEVLLYLVDKGVIKLPSSLDVLLGDLDWGTHVCQLYRSKEELLELLVPYFKQGLARNEFCVWVLPDYLTASEVRHAMVQGGADPQQLDRQLELIDYRNWYVAPDGALKELDLVLAAWAEKLSRARRQGFEGLRVTGDTSWVADSDWNDFVAYESKVHAAILQLKMIAVCTYPIRQELAHRLPSVSPCHEELLVKHRATWQRIGSAEPKRALDILTSLLE